MFRCLKLIVLVSIVLFSACSVNRLSEDIDRKNLTEEINRWRNFRLDGIIKINYHNLSFIQNVTVIRDSSQFKLLVYKNGIFGASPKPLARIEYKDSLLVDIPYVPKRKINELEKSFIGSRIFEGDYLINDLLSSLPQISESHLYSDENIQLLFTDEMQISSILADDGRFELNISHNSSGNPDKLDFFYEKDLVASIEIDKFISRE